MKAAVSIYSVCLLLFTACSNTAGPTTTPTQNDQLNAVSPSGKVSKKKGVLQQSYDAWEKEDWEPNIRESPRKKVHANKDASSEATREANGTFTLQHYVDKWGRYLDEKQKQRTEPTQSEKMNSMPVIGGER